MADEKQYPAALVELFDLIMDPTASAGVELVKRLEPVFRDAERYRWLRGRLLAVDWDYIGAGDSVLVFTVPAEISVSADCDATVDSAMRAEPAVGAA